MGKGRSLLMQRNNRVHPGGSQRWDQACEYGNHNEEQRCSRNAYWVRRTDTVQQTRDVRGTPPGSAASAMQIPISRDRWVTE